MNQLFFLELQSMTPILSCFVFITNILLFLIQQVQQFLYYAKNIDETNKKTNFLGYSHFFLYLCALFHLLHK